MAFPYEIVITIILLLLGYGFGRLAEKKHYASIIKREQELKDVLVFTAKSLPQGISTDAVSLVQGSVVVSVDYFKRFLYSLRTLIGGRVEAYETLLDRGRREAVLRMKEDAIKLDCGRIFNIKFETSSISRGQRDALGSIEVLVYGTALRLSDA